MAYRKNITLKLALITAPVDVSSGVEKEAENHQVCDGANTPHIPTQVKQSTACPNCGNADRTSFKLVTAGQEGLVALTKEEIAAAKALAVGDSNKLIELSAHPVEQVRAQTIPNGSVYFLAPSNPYVAQHVDLIKDAMLRHSELAFLGVFSPSGRPNLYEFRLFGESIIMVQLARTQDIKVLAQPIGELLPAYQDQMDAILAASATAYDPTVYADDVKVRMAALAASKATTEGEVLTATKSRSAALAPVVDLAAMMAASLTAAAPKKVRKPRAKKAAA